MARAPTGRRIAGLAVLFVAACGSGGPREIRVEMTGPPVAGAKWLSVALTVNPDYCLANDSELCSQIFQTEAPAPATRVFKLALPDELRNDIRAGFFSFGLSLRVEVRDDDHCLLARGTRLVPRDKDAMTIEISPAGGQRLCTLWIGLAGRPGATVSYGADSVCPASPLKFPATGATCFAELPKGALVELRAAGGSFKSWQGFADCAGKTAPVCSVRLNGPAALRAVSE